MMINTANNSEMTNNHKDTDKPAQSGSKSRMDTPLSTITIHMIKIMDIIKNSFGKISKGLIGVF